MNENVMYLVNKKCFSGPFRKLKHRPWNFLSRTLATKRLSSKVVWPSLMPILHGNELVECDRTYCFFNARPYVLDRERW